MVTTGFLVVVVTTGSSFDVVTTGFSVVVVIIDSLVVVATIGPSFDVVTTGFSFDVVTTGPSGVDVATGSLGVVVSTFSAVLVVSEGFLVEVSWGASFEVVVPTEGWVEGVPTVSIVLNLVLKNLKRNFLVGFFQNEKTTSWKKIQNLVKF